MPILNKITCIIHALSLGGMERVMSILLNDFSNRENVEVSLILIGRTRQIDFKIPKSIKVYKPDFYFNTKNRTTSTFRTIRFIRKTVIKSDPDTVLSFGEYWNSLVLLSLYGLKTPIFISDRSQPNKNLGKVQNFLRHRLYPTATGIIAQTEKAKEIAIRNRWNHNITVIGNPIRKIEDHRGASRENIVLTVGRLIPTKNIDSLIRIFCKCEMPEWRLIVIGGNAKRMNLLAEYQNLIKKMGMRDRIKLLGTQKDVDAYYKKCKIFAFTSSSEGFPNVIGEAMAAGLPIITYDCEAGPSDLVANNENGYLIPLFDEKSFVEKLKYLMQNEQKRIEFGQNSEKIIAKFATDKIADQFYHFILNEKSFK